MSKHLHVPILILLVVVIAAVYFLLQMNATTDECRRCVQLETQVLKARELYDEAERQCLEDRAKRVKVTSVFDDTTKSLHDMQDTMGRLIETYRNGMVPDAQKIIMELHLRGFEERNLIPQLEILDKMKKERQEATTAAGLSIDDLRKWDSGLQEIENVRKHIEDLESRAETQKMLIEKSLDDFALRCTEFKEETLRKAAQQRRQMRAVFVFLSVLLVFAVGFVVYKARRPGET